MANTIRNFLVGVGFDYDNQGEQAVTSGMDAIKGKVLQLGAVVAGGFGLSELTVGFANAKDELGKFSMAFDIVPSDVGALGQALEHEGGSLTAFMGQLESLSKMRDNLASGDGSFYGELGKFGIDAQVIIDAENATEAYIMLADQIESMERKDARAAIGALGFDMASLALLSKGTDEVRRILSEEKGVREITDEMVEQAARFNDASQRTGDLMGSFADHISSLIIPDINNSMEALNETLERNQAKTKTVMSIIKTGWDIATSDIMKNFVNDEIVTRDNYSALGELQPYQPTKEMMRSNQSASQSQQQKPVTPITVNTNLNLDGRIIDTRVIKVLAGEAQTAIDDTASSVEK